MEAPSSTDLSKRLVDGGKKILQMAAKRWFCGSFIRPAGECSGEDVSNQM